MITKTFEESKKKPKSENNRKDILPGELRTFQMWFYGTLTSSTGHCIGVCSYFVVNCLFLLGTFRYLIEINARNNFLLLRGPFGRLLPICYFHIPTIVIFLWENFKDIPNLFGLSKQDSFKNTFQIGLKFLIFNFVFFSKKRQALFSPLFFFK